jgi:sialate O-acetylesterase
LTAAKVAYGENVVDSGPIFKSMQVEGSQIRIKFSSLGSGLRVHDKYGYARGFAIAGADGKYQWARARQDDEDMLVSCATIQQPTAVRYDWSDTPDGNLYNKEGLPAIPFRTDSSRRRPQLGHHSRRLTINRQAAGRPIPQNARNPCSENPASRPVARQKSR